VHESCHEKGESIEEESPDSLVCNHAHFSSQCGDTFSAAVISEFSDHHLQRHLQHDPTLLYQRVRLLVYHAAHRVLYKEAGRSRACWEIARPDGCVKFVIGKRRKLMNRNFFKNLLLAAMLTAVLGAGTLSARQLRSEAKNFACGGGCDSTHPCKTGCICAFPLESTTGFCSTHPTGLQPPAK
jgi:hypothetical protein